MRALFVTILLVALVLPIGHAPASPPSDISAADLQTLRNLAAQGNSTAQYNFGVLYDFRIGVPQDFAMAREWYQKAAAKGHAGAQNNLGGLYEFGRGVTRNDVLAYMWYSLAAAHSADDEWRDLAAENRDEIAGHMTSAQIADAKKRAREWKPIQK